MKTSLDHLNTLRNLLGLGKTDKKKKQSRKINPFRFLPLIPLTVLTFVILFVRSPINASAWTPQTIPAWTGPLTPNHELSNASLLGLSDLEHPEDLAFDEQGRIYTGSDNGNIYRITLAPTGEVDTFETFTTFGGYPLGLAFDQVGNLIAAVKDIGLLSVAPSGEVTLLTNTVNDTPITYANSLVIMEDGLIYFSDSSVKFDRGWPYDVLEARPNGRVLAFDPQTNETYLVKDGLYFPNGMVLAPDGSYLLVNETTRYRIARYWLTGEKQGTWDIFVDNLPLLPDNISMDENGNYLLAGGRRLAMIDKVQTNAYLKNQMAKIPLGILRNFPNLKNNRYGLILILDSEGKIQSSLHDPEGDIYGISSARAYDGFIYISTLLGKGIARYPYQP